MTARRLDEDTAAQEQALDAALDELDRALATLGNRSKEQRRPIGGKRRPEVTALMVPVHEAWRAVVHAEEVATIAETDLDTARGEDGPQ